MMTNQNVWLEELGKFLLDVGKYVLTAVIISSFLGDRFGSWQWLVIASFFTVTMIVLGLLLIKFATSKKSRK